MEKADISASNKNIQELRSYLTNGIQIKQENGRYVIIPKDEVHDALRNYLSDGDTRAAEQLINIVENTPDEKDESTFKYTSRSIRISAPVYSALSQKAAIIRKPVTHVIGILASNDMKINLEKLISEGKYDESRVKTIYEEIEKWKNELLKSSNIGIDGEIIKQENEDRVRRLNERIKAANTESEKLRIKYNDEKIPNYLKNNFNVTEDYYYKDEGNNDVLPVYEKNVLYKVPVDLKKWDGKERFKDFFIEDMDTLVEKLYDWLIDIILRRDFPSVSNEARQQFKERFIKPQQNTDKNEPLIPMDYTIYPTFSVFHIWKNLDLNNFYHCLSKNILDNEYAKMVDAFAQDYPNDTKKIIEDIIKHNGGEDAYSAFFAYGLRMEINLDIKTRISPDMEYMIIEDPLYDSIIELKYERNSNSLERALFSVLYEGMSKDIGIPDVMEMKKLWASLYASRSHPDEMSPEYKEDFERIYYGSTGEGNKSIKDASYAVSLAQMTIMEAFAYKDYKNAKLFTGYLTDINNIQELSKYIAYYIEKTKSMVITLTMPNYLLGLWEKGKIDLTANEYVKKLIQTYGDQLIPIDKESH